MNSYGNVKIIMFFDKFIAQNQKLKTKQNMENKISHGRMNSPRK